MRKLLKHEEKLKNNWILVNDLNIMTVPFTSNIQSLCVAILTPHTSKINS